MKLTIQTGNSNVNESIVRNFGNSVGLNITQARILRGGETKIVVEYDEQSETRLTRSKVAELAAKAGLAVDKRNVVVTPRWAESLRNLSTV